MLLLWSIHAFVQGQDSRLVSSISDNPSDFALPSELLEASALNSVNNKIKISKYDQDLIEDGQKVRVIIQYRITEGLQSDIEIQNVPLSERAQYLEDYAADMHTQLALVTNELVQVNGLQILKSMRYSPFIVAMTDEMALLKMAEMEVVEQILQDGLSIPLTDVTNGIIGADIVKAQGCDGSGCAIAILDTGTDPMHNIFQNGKIVASGCFNSTTSTLGGSVSTCPNNMDEQISLTDGSAGTVCEVPVFFNAPFFIDNAMCGRHGNNVAGIAAGNSGNFNTEGVASGASLIPMNVFSFFPSFGSQLLSFTSDQVLALEWVLANALSYNICAVNMSLGGGQTMTPCDSDARAMVISMLRSMGVATTIASGNDGFNNSVGFPACISSAITVGATDNSDNLASFSNHDGALVDLLAPGVDVTSAYGFQTSTSTHWYSSLDGTSMAAPHVAGAFAILKAKYPLATVDQIENALKVTGKTVSHPTTGESVPRIQIDAAKSFLASFFTPEAVVAIPAFGQWALLHLGLLILIFSIAAQKRIAHRS